MPAVDSVDSVLDGLRYIVEPSGVFLFLKGNGLGTVVLSEL